MFKWESFLNQKDSMAIRFTPIWEEWQPITPMGKAIKSRLQPFHANQKVDWLKAIQEIQLLLPLVKDKDQFALYMKGIEDIKPILLGWQKGSIPNQIDWFHIQQFLVRTRKLLSFPSWEIAWDFFRKDAQVKWDQALTYLSRARESEREHNFHFEQLFPEVFQPIQVKILELEKEQKESLRRKKEEIEKELGFEIGRNRPFYISRKDTMKTYKIENHQAFVKIRETPFDIGFDWRETEDDIGFSKKKEELDLAWKEAEIAACKKLAEQLYPYLQDMINWVESLGRLDATYAKACLSATYNGTVPIWNDKTSDFILDGGTHPWLAHQWQKKGKVFTPVDLTVSKDEVTVIVGPNMGGKSVAIKTLGVCTMLAQMGFLVPAQSFSFTPVNGISFVGGDYEQMEIGLSSFGGELKELVRLWELAEDEHYLILCDEVGRGTNPEEGEALAVAIVEALTDKKWYSCFVSHFSAVAHNPKIRLYEIIGLRESMDQSFITADNWNELIDHRLQLVQKGSVPQTAIKLAKWMGMPESIVLRATDILENQNVVRNMGREEENE